jgi:hypothetical protein
MAKTRMTEKQWLREDSSDPYRMVYFLDGRRLRNRPSVRKARLFACACVRRTLGELKEPWQRRAVETAERFADGLAAEDELKEAIEAARGQPDCSFWAADTNSWWEAAEAALHAGGQDDDNERAECGLLRCVVGNPFRRPPAIDPAWLAWNGGTVPRLAQSVYDERAFDRLPPLADALEDAGCADADLLGHLRGPGPHVRGCWVVDLLLGKP